MLAGDERWISPALGGSLRSYAAAGGTVLSLGISSLLRFTTVRDGTAIDPRGPIATNVLDGRPGTVVTGNRDLVTVIRDQLGIFTGTSGAFAGYGAFEPLTVADGGTILSAAGTAAAPPTIVGYRLGRGTVIDVGLPGFARSLDTNVDARQFLARLWAVLGR